MPEDLKIDRLLFENVIYDLQRMPGPMKVCKDEQSMKHFAKYIVVHLSFADIAGSNFEEVQDQLIKSIELLYLCHIVSARSLVPLSQTCSVSHYHKFGTEVPVNGQRRCDIVVIQQNHAK